MATVSQSDQLAELSLAMLDVYRSSGLARQRVGFGADGLGRLARLSGQTAEQVSDQLEGRAEPLPGQALALCRALRLAGAPDAAALNGRSG